MLFIWKKNHIIKLIGRERNELQLDLFKWMPYKCLYFSFLENKVPQKKKKKNVYINKL